MSLAVVGARTSLPILERSFVPATTLNGFQLRSSEFVVMTNFQSWEFVRFGNWILERRVVVAGDVAAELAVVVAVKVLVEPLPPHS